MLEKQIICNFLFLIVLCLSQDFQLPYGYKKYDEWKKSVPKNEKIPSQLIKYKIQSNLKTICGITIKKTMLQSYKGLWQTSFYIIYQTEFGYLSVFALCNSTTPMEKIKILQINFFSHVDNSLFQYVELTPQKNSQDNQQEQQEENIFSLQQFLRGKKKQYKINMEPLHAKYIQNKRYTYNLQQQLSLQCKKRKKIKNLNDKQQNQITSLPQFIKSFKDKRKQQKNTKILIDSIRKAAQSSITSEDNKQQAGDNMKKNLKINQSV